MVRAAANTQTTPFTTSLLPLPRRSDPPGGIRSSEQWPQEVTRRCPQWAGVDIPTHSENEHITASLAASKDQIGVGIVSEGHPETSMLK